MSPVAYQQGDWRMEIIERGEILTRQDVVSAALALIDASGVQALSMRKLGQALNRDPMRMYRHAENKAALLDAVAELVLEGLVAPTAADGDWETAVRRAAHSFRTVALAHPSLVPLLIDHPLTVPADGPVPVRLRWLEGLLAVFRQAGFDDDGAVHAFRFLAAFLAGQIAAEVRVADPPGPLRPAGQLGLDSLAGTDYPRIQALAPRLTSTSGSAEFLVGLDLVLLGLRSRLDQLRRPPAPPAPMTSTSPVTALEK